LVRRFLLWAFFAVSLLLSSEAETFKNPQLIVTGSAPATVIEGDLNGDGKPDLVYGDVSGMVGTLHVLLNDGNGQFRPSQTIGPIAPLFVAEAADVNGDGKLDLILVSPSDGPSPALDVALGNGDGTFESLITSPLPSYITSAASAYAVIKVLVVADVNGDGKQDVVFSDLQGRQIWICLGDNTGHFTQTTELNDQNPSDSLFLGDFNQDGKTDVIGFEDSADRAVVYLTNGNGTFAPPVYYSGPGGLASMLVTDMDGDGHPDMLINGYDDVLRVLHGNSDGTFAPTLAFPVPVGAKGMYPEVLDVEDYNHDGVLDIALTSVDGIHILIGQGNFTFKPFQPAVIGGALAIGDLNQDKNIDFVSTSPAGLAVLYGNPDGSLRSADSYDVGYGVSSAAVADFNGDGNPDVAVGVGAIDPRILAGGVSGAFTLLADTNTASGQINDIGSISAGDLNGDGHVDLVSSYGFLSPGALQGIASSLGNGDGTFAPPVFLPGYSLSAFGTVIGDLNNDGRADVAATADGIYQTSFFLGQSDGQLLEKSTVSNNLSIGAYTVYGDFNKDGKLDLAFLDVGDLQVENGNGDGTFSAGFAYHAPGGPSLTSPSFSDAVVADLDGDGNIDIAAPTGFQLQVFYGHGDGTFDPPAYMALAPPPPPSVYTPSYTGINAADFNGDGLMDLVLTDDDGVFVLHGAGNRAFGSATNYLAGNSPGPPLVADFNHDGYPDILVADQASTVTILLNMPDACPCVIASALKVSPEPSTFSQPFTIHLSLAGSSSGAGSPMGSATFSIDGTALGTVKLVNGMADFAVSIAVPVGVHQISVRYGGDPVFHSATFTVSHTVLPLAGTTQNVQTVLTAAPNPVSLGLPVVLTAKVTATTAVQVGSVAFNDGGTLLANVLLGQGGAGTFTTSSLAAGTHALTAVYSGGSGLATSTSNTVSLLVQQNTTGGGGTPGGTSGDFALQVSHASATVYTGAAANLQVTVAASGGFAQDVALACSGLPAEAGCIFNPSLASGGNGHLALTLQTTAPHPITQANRTAPPWAPLGTAGIVSALACIVMPRRTRLTKKLYVVLTVIAVVTMMSACSGPGLITGGTPPGVYNIAVTGTATPNGRALSHSITVQLTVKAFR
jgi:Bacterial Ig-like domain (group 3)/FG-GAP-like repeat